MTTRNDTLNATSSSGGMMYGTFSAFVENEARQTFALKVGTGEYTGKTGGEIAKARSKYVRAIVNALAAFRSANRLEDFVFLGDELVGPGYETALRTMVECIDRNASARVFKAKMNAHVRPMALRLIDLGDVGRKVDFADRLDAAMTARSVGYRKLAKWVSTAEDILDPFTLYAWQHGRTRPTGIQSRRWIDKIEQVLQVPAGSLTDALPKREIRCAPASMSLGLSKSEARRFAYFLDGVAEERQEEALVWIKDTLFKSPTHEVLDDDGELIREPYAFRLSSEQQPKRSKLPVAPKRLGEQLAELRHHKTAVSPGVGIARHKEGLWGPYTADKGISDLLRFMGAFKEMGICHDSIHLGICLSEVVIDQYVSWYTKRRGAITLTAVNTLQVICSLLHPVHGFITQRPDLFGPIERVDGFVPTAVVDRVKTKGWQDACQLHYADLRRKISRLEKMAPAGRDMFAPLLPVLEAKQPAFEYFEIYREMLRSAPDKTYPFRWALATRDKFAFRIVSDLVFRKRNWVEMLVVPPGGNLRKGNELERLGVMELSLAGSGDLRVRAHASAFKNVRSRAVRGIRPEHPFMVRDSLGMQKDFLDYIKAREILLNGHTDPGTLFVKNMASRAKEPQMDGHAFYEMWLNAIRRYGVKNPFNGRGAIEGLGPHGPHGVRDVKATHALKTGGPGAIAEAAASLLDTEDMVRDHYVRYLPQDGNQQVRDTYYDGLEERFS